MRVSAARPRPALQALPAGVAALSLAACGGEDAAPLTEPLRIGATMSLTGAFATQGVPAANGYRLCVEHLNAEGGLLGRPVTLVLEDDRSSSEEVVRLYEALLSEGEDQLPPVDAILGPYGSTLTEAVAPVTERHGRVHVSPLAATSSIWEQGRRHLFMVLPPAERFLAGIVEIAREDGLNRVGVLHEDALFPQAAARGAVELAESLGMEVAFESSYPAGTEDFSEILARAREEGVEVVAMAASDLDGFIRFTGALREAQSSDPDFPVRLLGTSGAVAEFQAALGDAAEGVYGLSAWEPSLPNPGNEAFVAAYGSEFDRAPSFHAAGAYGSCRLFAQAVEEAGTLEDDAVRDVLLGMETTTVFGPFQVDERGYQVANQGVFIQWQDGDKVVVWPPELATHPRR
jgi:branched-chain amino acid transport system substrate-binding protein